MKKNYVAIFSLLLITYSHAIKAQPANDNCSGAILVNTIPYNDLTTDYTNANTSGATRSTPDPSCITGSDNNDDIWYKFVANTQTELLRVQGAVSGTYVTFGYALYDGCGGTEIACNNQMGTFYGNEMLGGLTLGNTYFLRFWSLHNFTSMTFSFVVMDINPITPANSPNNATQLTVNSAGAKCIAPQFFTTASATRSSPDPSCSSDNDDDVWFQFTMPSSGVSILPEEGTLISSGGYANMGMEIIDATAGFSITCQSNSNIGSTISLGGGNVGNIYQIRLWTVGTTDRAVFSLCIQEGFGTIVPNNTCATATLLTVGAGTCTKSVIGNLFNADNTLSLLGNPDCTVNTTLKTDIWYKAVVPASGNLIVQTSATNSAVNDLVMLAYKNNCSTFTQIACDEDGNTAPFPSANHPRISLTGQTPGDTILFRVLPRNDNNMGQFSICAFDESVAALPEISVSNVSKVEGFEGIKHYNFNISLNKPGTNTVTVKYETVDNTATAPSDYTAVARTKITFNPGDTIKTVTVNVNGDTSPESDEIFKVKLLQPVNATIVDVFGKGTIRDDDTPQAQGISNSINENKDDDDELPKIYPNPATEKLNVYLPASNNTYMITISSIAGATIKKIQVKPSEKLLSINIKDLINGMYVVRIQSDTKNISLKFIKE